MLDIERFIAGLHDYLNDAFRPCVEADKKLAERCAALERRIAELETGTKASGVPYAGTWRHGKEFPAGVFATHNGSLWHCNASTTDQPGTSPHWTMAVRGGGAK